MIILFHFLEAALKEREKTLNAMAIDRLYIFLFKPEEIGTSFIR